MPREYRLLFERQSPDLANDGQYLIATLANLAVNQLKAIKARPDYPGRVPRDDAPTAYRFQTIPRR